MRNHFYKLNKKYIDNFSKKVLYRFKNMTTHSDSIFLKSLFKELNELFKFIGGMISSKENIPKITDYPDSSKFNQLINDIGTDIQKLYTSQTIINNDVNNLLTFNSTQRIKTYENLTSTQQQVYSLYIKNKSNIGGEYIIPSENPFTSSDNITTIDSNGVVINQDRGSLTLEYSSSINKPIDYNNIFIYFAKTIPINTIYPNNRSLHLGSHWKTDNGAHYIGDNLSDVQNYRYMMIDTPNANTGIGWCEFEAVSTEINTVDKKIQSTESVRLTDITNGVFSSIYSKRFIIPDEQALKNYIGKMFNRDAESVYFDLPNSLQGKYISYNSTNLLFTNPQYKLVIPFNQSSNLTNEIGIDFEPDALGFFPKIIWEESKVFSNDKGSEIAYSLLSPSSSNEITTNGEYRCIIKEGYIKPSRIELILEYGSDPIHWVPISFMMSHYVYNTQQNYMLYGPEYPTDSNDKITLILNKVYDVFVDSEHDIENEKNRALNVLLSRNK